MSCLLIGCVPIHNKPLFQLYAKDLSTYLILNAAKSFKVFVREFPSKDLYVLLDPLRVTRFGNATRTSLYGPPY